MSKPGQIDLFTKRVRKATSPRERELHIAIADTLRVACQPGWIWWHVPNGELRTHATGALLQRMGVKPGVSDFNLLNVTGTFHALEIKRVGEKPTEAQARWMAQVALCHGRVAWVDGYNEAVEVLQEWGALSPRFHPQ